MAKVRSLYFGAASLLLAAFVVPQTFVPAQAEQIAATVNSIVITGGDVAKRVKFLQLRGEKGNLQQKAKQELVDEVLMRQEIIRTGTSVSTEDVEGAYERFGKNNRMSAAQLTQLLTRAGVGPEHFKAYIGVSMSWPKTVAARFGGNTGGRMTNDEFVAKLKENNGKKPTVTEYVIQQVIFVIPDKKRNAISGKRKAEAEASRKSFPGCAQAKVFAAGFKDVSVRQQQRVLETQFPDEMKAEMAKLPEGGTTKVTMGPYGAEFYALCKKRQVSDDLAAQVTFETQDVDKAKKEGDNPNAKKYLEELRQQNEVTMR